MREAARMRSRRAYTVLAAFIIALTAPVSAADTSTWASLPKPHSGGVPWTASQVTSLRASIARVLGAKTLRGAQVGLLLIDTDRSTVLDELAADQEFMPASNFKLLTGSAALEQLPPGFSYTTSILADAPIDNGTIRGNVYLRGGGDALLSAADLEAAAAALYEKGLRTITGSIVTDSSYFDDQRLGFGWSWDDLPYYYAPVVSALELEDGVVHVFMTPAAAAGQPVQLRIEPQSTAFTIENRLTTGFAGSKDTSDIVRPWNSPSTIVLTGSYPLGAKESGDLMPSVPDPPAYAGNVLARALADRGIHVENVQSGTSPANAAVLWSHASETLPELLADFWSPSDNLMGEELLKALGVAHSGAPGTDANGILAEQQFLRSIGVDPATVSITDGSGLSQYDRITPRDLCAILQYDWHAPHRDMVLNALPVAGVRGTLKDSYVGTPAERNVFAKTGSISHVRTISGFVQTRTHGPVTFSLLINQWMGEDDPNGAQALARARGALFALLAAQ